MNNSKCIYEYTLWHLELEKESENICWSDDFCFWFLLCKHYGQLQVSYDGLRGTSWNNVSPQYSTENYHATQRLLAHKTVLYAAVLSHRVYEPTVRYWLSTKHYCKCLLLSLHMQLVNKTNKTNREL